MKRHLMIIATVLMLALMFGCGKKEEDVNTGAQEMAEQNAEPVYAGIVSENTADGQIKITGLGYSIQYNPETWEYMDRTENADKSFEFAVGNVNDLYSSVIVTSREVENPGEFDAEYMNLAYASEFANTSNVTYKGCSDVSRDGISAILVEYATAIKDKEVNHYIYIFWNGRVQISFDMSCASDMADILRPDFDGLLNAIVFQQD